MLELSKFILAHHEKWYGTGYPKGLKGEAIPQIARIFAEKVLKKPWKC